MLNLKVDCTAIKRLINLRRPAMSDDAVDYGGRRGGTSDSPADSESDKIT